MNRHPDLGGTDDLLKEWGWFFRDRKTLSHCKSIEHRFRATSEDFGPDGWGDVEAAPKSSPARSYAILRALRTHDAVQQLPVVNKWAITYGFAYPYLPKFVVLRMMKKWTGRQVNWRSYLELVDIGRYRVHCLLSTPLDIDRKSA